MAPNSHTVFKTIIISLMFSSMIKTAMAASNNTAVGFFRLGPKECFGHTCTQGQFCSKAAWFGGKCRQCEDVEMYEWCKTSELREQFRIKYPSCFYICAQKDDVQTLNATLHTVNSAQQERNMQVIAAMHAHEGEHQQNWQPGVTLGVASAVIAVIVVGIVLILRWRKQRRSRDQDLEQAGCQGPANTMPADIRLEDDEGTSLLTTTSGITNHENNRNNSSNNHDASYEPDMEGNIATSGPPTRTQANARRSDCLVPLHPPHPVSDENGSSNSLDTNLHVRQTVY